MNSDSELFAVGRTINVRRNFYISMSANRPTNAKFEQCNMEVGSIMFDFYDKAQSANYTYLNVIDSNVNVKGDLSCLIPANDRFENPVPRGVTIFASGKSKLTFNGGAIIDEIFNISPNEWFFKWCFEEKGGEIGYVFFNKKAVFDSCILELKVSSNIRRGRHVLMDLANNKSSFNPMRIIFNGKPYSFGETVMLGDKSVKVELGYSPNGRDLRNKNDIIMEVK